MTYEFSLQPDSDTLEALLNEGFEEIDRYSTVRCGTIVTFRAPSGTIREDYAPIPGTTDKESPYSRSARFYYRCPAPSLRPFLAGGGGPSDPDTLHFTS